MYASTQPRGGSSQRGLRRIVYHPHWLQPPQVGCCMMAYKGITAPRLSLVCCAFVVKMLTSTCVKQLPTYSPSTAEQADPSLFARNVRAAMVGACTFASHSDAYVVRLKSQCSKTPVLEESSDTVYKKCAGQLCSCSRADCRILEQL